MNRLSIGKLRGLQQLANAKGMLTVCAIDHRGSLKQALNQQNPDAVSYQDIVDFKLDLCRVLTPLASAVLLDPIYGAAPAIAAGALSGHTGLLVSIEKTGYTGETTARITELLPDWGVEKIKRMGASAVKLLLYLRTDLKDITQKQLDLVARLADECIAADIPLLVEPVSYPVEAIGTSSKMFADMKPGLVIEAARLVTALPIDVLKSEFPDDTNFEKDEKEMLEHCRQLDQASALPWVLLSAGVDFDCFSKQLEVACQAGASGFLAGRALWQEATTIPSRADRMDFFKNTVTPRFKRLVEIADSYGRPWYNKLSSKDGEFTPVVQDWYRNY